MSWWWKQKRDAQIGREEAERALAEARERDRLIIELGCRHREMVRANGFGEAAERAIIQARRGWL